MSDPMIRIFIIDHDNIKYVIQNYIIQRLLKYLKLYGGGINHVYKIQLYNFNINLAAYDEIQRHIYDVK